MDIKVLILIVALLTNLFLALSLWRRAKDNWSTAIFMISVGMVIFWTFSIIFYRVVSLENSLVWTKILYFSAPLIPLTFLYFAFLFPSEKFTLSKLKTLAIAIPTILIICFVLYQDLIIKEVLVRAGQEKYIVFGPLYPLYSIYIGGYFGWALLILFKKYKKSIGILRTQISYILTGTLISIILGATFNLILPTIGDFRFNWLGQVSTLAMVLFITYAIIKKQLFEIRIVLTQLLVSVIAILLLVNIFFSQTSFEYTWKSVLLIAFLAAGYLLIKSVLNEIKYKEQLQKAYEDLKVLDKAKSEFISMASHQLRTPLSAIKGYISMLVDGSYGKLPEKARGKLKNVFESNERLIRVVNDLLDISKIEMGKMELEKEPTQIEDLLQSCYEEMKIGADKKGLKFVFEKPKYSLPKIELDPLKFRQAILNLIDNAIRYTQKGEIEIKVEKVNSASRISVKDTGEGLTAEEQRAAFGGFTRGSAGIAHFVEGAGLGLYVAKKFLELHHAKIWVESEGKGKGSIFYVELPIK